MTFCQCGSIRKGLVARILAVALPGAALLGAVTATAQDEAVLTLDGNDLWANPFALVPEVPATLPVHLFVRNATVPVAGWEAMLRIDGPGLIASVEYEGETVINVLQPPGFMVGIGGQPLYPNDGVVKLATVNITILAPEPVTLTLEPVFYASLPGEISILDPEGGLHPLMLPGPVGFNVCPYDCPLLTTEVFVPEIGLGETTTVGTAIMNYDWEKGCGSYVLDVFLDGGSPDFHLTTISGVVDWDYRVLSIPVEFQPLSIGYHETVLHLGSVCADVPMAGVCRDPIVGDDHVGVFFDEHASIYETTVAAGATVTAHLTLLHPSSSAGVAGWEGCVAVIGDAEIVSWDLNGTAVNELAAPCFRVDVDEPLQDADADGVIRLASFEVRSATGTDEARILITPVPDATLPNQLSWTTASATPSVLPLAGYLPGPVVARINSEGAMPVADSPVAAGGRLSAYPNPFNPRTEVRFELERAGHARVTLHDVSGRRVRTLVNEELPAGPVSRAWNGRDDAGRRLPSGLYMIRLESPGRIDQEKVLLLK